LAQLSPRTELACALFCAGMALVSAGSLASGAPSRSPEEARSTRAVYFDGRSAELSFERVRRASAAFRFGPWELDAYASREKPKDPRPNLYIVAPGEQYTAEAAPSFDHTEIISTMPLNPEPREWDVYWALVLDPTLKDEFHSERQLILATQDGFPEPAGYTVESLPAYTFLKQFLKVQTAEDLERYRRPDGTLPRLIIVPAGVSIKAIAIDPQNPPEEKKSRVSRAFDAVLHRRDAKPNSAESTNNPKQ
jgi:hypothetical protein